MAPVCRYQMASCRASPFRTGFGQCFVASDSRGARMVGALYIPRLHCV